MCYYPFFSGANLPDDDYTTLVPPVKLPNTHAKQKSTVITDKTNGRSSPRQDQNSANRNENERKTTIISVSNRRSTIDNDAIEQTRSAPVSPALNRPINQRLMNKRIPLGTLANESKSVSVEHCSSPSTNGPSQSLSSGQLEIRLKYDVKNSKIWIFVLKATLEMNTKQTTLVQIHLTALPSKRIRYRTRVKPIENAMFAEEFFFKIPSGTIQSQGIRFRLYTYERFKREKLLAEAIVMFAKVNLDEDMCKIVSLERPYSSQDSDIGLRSYSQQDSFSRSREGTVSSLLPELEIGLSYDKNQSILVLEIGKGINFDMANTLRAPDTYVQITLRNSLGEDIISNRTAIRQAQHHPVYAERYPFNIQENFLEQITIILTVICRKLASKTEQELGTIIFGRETTANPQVYHWQSMLDAQGETITRWHALNEK